MDESYCHLLPGDTVVGDDENYPFAMKFKIGRIEEKDGEWMVYSNPDYGQAYYAKYLRRVRG